VGSRDNASTRRQGVWCAQKSKAPGTRTLGYQKEAAVQKAERAGEIQTSALFDQLEKGGISPIVAVCHIYMWYLQPVFNLGDSVRFLRLIPSRPQTMNTQAWRPVLWARPFSLLQPPILVDPAVEEDAQDLDRVDRLDCST
jgi:hypothetical protein